MHQAPRLSYWFSSCLFHEGAEHHFVKLLAKISYCLLLFLLQESVNAILFVSLWLHFFVLVFYHSLLSLSLSFYLLVFLSISFLLSISLCFYVCLLLFISLSLTISSNSKCQCSHLPSSQVGTPKATIHVCHHHKLAFQEPLLTFAIVVSWCSKS